MALFHSILSAAFAVFTNEFKLLTDFVQRACEAPGSLGRPQEAPQAGQVVEEGLLPVAHPRRRGEPRRQLGPRRFQRGLGLGFQFF